MPTGLRLGALRFVIYVDDHPPPHVHVEGKGRQAKIALDGPTLVWDRGFARADMKSALDAVRLHRAALIDAWTTIHG